MTSPNTSFAGIICGGYAWGNTGDEICLAAALARKEREFGGSVAILSHRPELTARLFPGANVIPYVLGEPFSRRFKHARAADWKGLLTAAGSNYFGHQHRFLPDSAWARAIAGAQELYFAGGGYLNDLFGLGMYLEPMELAHRLRVPVATAPVGLGPFASETWAGRTVQALRPVDLTVRDQVSLEFCRQHGLAAKRAPDDGFAWVQQLPSPGGEKPARPKIGVCIFPQYGVEPGRDHTRWWVDCLRALAARHQGHGIEGFCFHTSLGEEYGAMKKLFPLAGLPPQCVREPVEDFRQAVACVRAYDFIISTRFHATVTANVFHIPNIAIACGGYYRAKMQSAAAGYEPVSSLVDPQQTSLEAMLALCDQKLRGLAAKIY